MDETLQREKHQETACGAGNLNSLSRFPSGESRGGLVPPTPHKARLPPQEGCRPLVNPPHGLASDEHLGTFYLARFRNFLFCVDTTSSRSTHRLLSTEIRQNWPETASAKVILAKAPERG